MSVAPEEKTKIKMSVAPEDGEGKQTRARTDSVESLESLEDPFDVNYDPTEGKDSYGGRTALGTDPAEEVLGFKARARRFCEDPHSSKIATWFHLLYATVIIASCVAFCTETLNFKGQPQGNNLSVANYELLEALFTGIFTADILIRAALAARVCCCCKGTKGGGAKEGDGSLAPVPFFLDIMVIFDILSVLPLPIGAIITATGLGTEFPWLGSSVRVLSICRILRIFKVTRNFEGAKVLFVTMKNSIRPLTVSFIVLIAVMSIVSAVLYFVEPCYEEGCVFTDQMNAAYFLVITLTTIGYGDQIPASQGGKFVAVVIAFLGSFYMAMPLAIIGSKFEEAYKEHELLQAQHSSFREDNLKEQLSHVSSKERRARVLRLGFKIQEIVTMSIKSHESESRFHMKAFPKKADIMCADISILFEEAMKGTILDRSMSILDRQESARKLKAKAKAKNKRKPRRHRDRMPTAQSLRAGMMRKVHEAHKAKQSNKCRDKVWLTMNASGPDQSKWSRRLRNFQLAIVFLSIGTVALETLPELNRYGPDSRMCKQVVSYFCSKVVQNADNETIARAANPGCFPLDVEVNGKNVSYGGCLVKSGDYEKDCDFPSPAAAMTCTQEPYSYEEYSKDKNISWTNTGNVDANATKRTVTYTVGTKYFSGSADEVEPTKSYGRIVVRDKTSGTVLLNANPYDPVLAFDPNWEGLEGDKDIVGDEISAMCDRTQCTENNVKGTNYPELFFYGEVFFIVLFSVETIVRITVMRSCRTFWLDVSNLIDISAALVALAEIVWIPMQWGKPAYEVWGMGGSMDPATFRVTRILVAVRFISLQRQNGGLKVISETIYRTGNKLVIPSVFFFLFVLLFAGVFYTAESGSLYKCPPEIEAQMDEGWVHRKFMEPDWPTRVCGNNLNSTSRCCEYCVDANPREGRDVENPRDGSCKLLVVKSDDTITYTMIEDMFDAMWTMIITMTTVGYGGKYPRTMTGKFVAVASAILGSLYMAMPLTIVGNKFYEVYEMIEQQRAKAMYKSAQILHKKKLAEEAEKGDAGSGKGGSNLGRSMSILKTKVAPSAGVGLNIQQVISLKRWVYRTKRELQIQDLSEEEQLAIQDFLKRCHKMCRLSLHTRDELIEYERVHTKLMTIVSRHCIHRHADGIDTIEATLY